MTPYTIIRYTTLFLMMFAAGIAVICFMTDSIGLGIFNLFLIGINFWTYSMNEER